MSFVRNLSALERFVIGGAVLGPVGGTVLGLWGEKNFGPISLENSLNPIEGFKSIMGEIMPKQPEPPAVPAGVSLTDPSIAAAAARAAENERKATLLRRGRSSTILAGDTLGQSYTKKATLLGG